MNFHAIQLEAAFQWFVHTTKGCEGERLHDRKLWFAAMQRANCLICEGAIEVNEYGN